MIHFNKIFLMVQVNYTTFVNNLLKHKQNKEMNINNNTHRTNIRIKVEIFKKCILCL